MCKFVFLTLDFFKEFALALTDETLLFLGFGFGLFAEVAFYSGFGLELVEALKVTVTVDFEVAAFAGYQLEKLFSLLVLLLVPWAFLLAGLAHETYLAHLQCVLSGLLSFLLLFSSFHALMTKL
jgi:hypothetical protein